MALRFRGLSVFWGPDAARLAAEVEVVWRLWFVPAFTLLVVALFDDADLVVSFDGGLTVLVVLSLVCLRGASFASSKCSNGRFLMIGLGLPESPKKESLPAAEAPLVGFAGLVAAAADIAGLVAGFDFGFAICSASSDALRGFDVPSGEGTLGLVSFLGLV